jgi:hypothetical protein
MHSVKGAWWSAFGVGSWAQGKEGKAKTATNERETRQGEANGTE